MSMVNPNDLYTNYSGIDNEEQIIDSYELFQNLIIDLEGQGTFRFKLDIILPFIIGNPSYIEKIFKGFLVQAMSDLQGEIGTIEIIHIKDHNSWIFGLLIQNLTSSEIPKVKTKKKHTVSEFKLVISKKAHMRFESFLSE